MAVAVKSTATSAVKGCLMIVDSNKFRSVLVVPVSWCYDGAVINDGMNDSATMTGKKEIEKNQTCQVCFRSS